MTTRARVRVVAPLVLVACAGIAAAIPVQEVGPLPGDARIAPATNSQTQHAAARGGAVTLVVWSDMRPRSSGSQTVQADADIYGVRLGADGRPIDATPFLIAGGMGLQDRPLVAWNGQNWLVVYQSQDPVGQYFGTRVRAVRVSPAGDVLDAVPLALPPTQFEPETIGMQVAGQDGQWLITRCVYHNDGYGTYLAGQRVSGAGVLLDAAPVMLNDWVYGQTMLLANNGEYLAVGPDWYDSSSIKARRVSAGASLAPVGASFTLPGATVGAGAGEYYVVWVKDFVNLVGSRVSATGTLLTPAGTPIVSDFTQYHHSTLAHDGAQWWLEWGAASTLRTVRISASGAVLDPNGGVQLPIVIGGSIGNAYDPRLVAREGGGVHLVWHDFRAALGSDGNVFALPVSSANVPGTEACASTGAANQRNPDFTPGPAGASAIAFVSEHANDDRVLLQLLTPAGTPATPEPVEVFRGPTVGRAGVAYNGASYMVVWDQGAAGLTPTGVYARRLNPDGTFIDAQPLSVMPGFNPDVEALGGNFLVAGARFGVNPQFILLYGSRVDGASGALLDGSGGVYLGGNYVSAVPRVRTDGAQWYVAAHSMWTHDSSQGDAILSRVPLSGPPVLAVNPTPYSGGSGDLDIASSPTKRLLVWRTNSLSNANNFISGRIMNADGSFATGAFTIAEASGRQLRPTAAWDGSTFVVAWDDQREQGSFYDASTAVYATRVSEAGVVLDPAGVRVVAGPGACSPTLLSAGGVTLLASARYTPAEGLAGYRVGLSRLGAPACRADLNGDGELTFDDVQAFVAYFNASDPRADLNTDGEWTFDDIQLFVQLYNAGC